MGQQLPARDDIPTALIYVPDDLKHRLAVRHIAPPPSPTPRRRRNARRFYFRRQPERALLGPARRPAATGLTVALVAAEYWRGGGGARAPARRGAQCLFIYGR